MQSGTGVLAKDYKKYNEKDGAVIDPDQYFKITEGYHADVNKNGEAEIFNDWSDLEEKIEKGDGREIRGQYNHINSLLKGIEYTLDYISDEQAREHLVKAVSNMKELLESRYNTCKKIVDQWNEEHLK